MLKSVLYTRDVQDALDRLRRLEQESSNLGKKSILEGGRDNQVFRVLLISAYDPYRVYYIKDFTIESEPVEDSCLVDNLCGFLELLQTLQERKVTGKSALELVKNLFSLFSAEERKWYGRVLKKDLNIGIKSKTINSVLPGLIPEFGVQLAREYDGRLPRRVIVQPKLDGYRVLGSTTTGKLYSRNGKLIEGYGEIERQLRLLPRGLVIDGEIISRDSFKGTQQSVFRKSTRKEGLLDAFDLICETSSELERVDQLGRMWKLREILNACMTTSILPLEYRVIDSFSVEDRRARVQNYYEHCIFLGYEGIMIKDAEAPYERKRSYNWQKLKPVNSIDLRVIGVEPGGSDTKYEDCVGRLVCDFEGNEVRIGSGLLDEQREAWWINPNLIIGKTIEVLYQEISNNQSGGRSLRFPRFKRIRPDKD